MQDQIVTDKLAGLENVGLKMTDLLIPISLIFLLVICVLCPRSYCSLCHVNLYVLLLLLLLLLGLKFDGLENAELEID